MRNDDTTRDRRESAGDRSRPTRAAPMQWGRGAPWMNAYQGQLGHEPHYDGYGEYGWGGGGGPYKVLLPAGALVPNHAGRGPRGYTRADARIEEEINDRLTWHPDLDASGIDVRVQRGEVTLAGTVDSRFAKRLARDIADSVDGVRDVHNRLTIQQGV